MHHTAYICVFCRKPLSHADSLEIQNDGTKKALIHRRRCLARWRKLGAKAMKAIADEVDDGADWLVRLTTTNPSATEFGRLVREYRAKTGLTGPQFAEKCGVRGGSCTTWSSQVETHKIKRITPYIETACGFLGITPEEAQQAMLRAPKGSIFPIPTLPPPIQLAPTPKGNPEVTPEVTPEETADWRGQVRQIVRALVACDKLDDMEATLLLVQIGWGRLAPIFPLTSAAESGKS